LKQFFCPGGNIFVETLLGAQNIPDCYENVLNCHIIGDAVDLGFYVKEEEQLGSKDLGRAIVCFQQRDNRSLP
jgi:hypothetical protein